MNNLKLNNCNGREFFGAVSKNCETVVVRKSEDEVKKEIYRRDVAKNNVVIFKCQSAGEKTIAKKPIHRPRFKLTHNHHKVLTEAGLNFLAQNKIA